MNNRLHLGLSLLLTLGLRPVRESVSLGGTIPTFIVIWTLLLAFRMIYNLWIYPSYLSPLRHLPGPKDHHFLFGQTLKQFQSGSPNEPFVSWMKKWPDAQMLRYSSLFGSEAILITGLETYKEILTDKGYSFVKPAVYEKLIRPIVGKGIVFSHGDEHRAQRKFLSPPFSITELKRLIPVFYRKASQLCKYFDAQIATNSGVVELVSTYSSLTLDIIGIAALGIDLENLEHPSTFHECYHAVFDPPPLGQLLVFLDGFVPIRWLPLAENRRFAESNAVVRKLLRQIIRDRIVALTTPGGQGEKVKKEGKEEEEGYKDILSYIITETYTPSTRPWDEEEILGHMLNMVAAGHETTASALVWATHAMVTYPGVQTRLRAEIMELVNNRLGGEMPGYVDMEGLAYLGGFCKEVLRVHCPAITSPREPINDITINGVLIPKGTTINLMCQTIQMNPTIWGPDADSFRPERWSDGGGRPDDVHAFTAFFHGPRQCIGRVFSIMEFKAILIKMITNFAFEPVPGQSITLINPSALLRPKGGLKVRIRRLTAAELGMEGQNA